MAHQEPAATSKIQKELHPAEALDTVFDHRQRVSPDTAGGGRHNKLTPLSDLNS
jgi:hypothetical protein